MSINIWVREDVSRVSGTHTVTQCTRRNCFHIYFSASVLQNLPSKQNRVIAKMLMPWSRHINIIAFICDVLSLVLPHWSHRCFHRVFAHRTAIAFFFFCSSVVSHQIKVKTFPHTPALNSCHFCSLIIGRDSLCTFRHKMWPFDDALESSTWGIIHLGSFERPAAHARARPTG